MNVAGVESREPERAEVRYCTSPVGPEEPSCHVETHVDGAAVPCVVVFNGGSSSIRFAVYEAGATLRRRLDICPASAAC